DGITPQNRLGALFGFGMDFQISKNLDFTSGLSYTGKAVKVSSDTPWYYFHDGELRSTNEFSVNYGLLELPLFLKLHLGGSKFQFSIFGGPSISAIVFPSVTVPDGTALTMFSPNHTELAIGGGAQLDWSINDLIGFFVGTRYARGLTNVMPST